jgi:hypothetical protein
LVFPVDPASGETATQQVKATVQRVLTLLKEPPTSGDTNAPAKVAARVAGENQEQLRSDEFVSHEPE